MAQADGPVMAPSQANTGGAAWATGIVVFSSSDGASSSTIARAVIVRKWSSLCMSIPHASPKISRMRCVYVPLRSCWRNRSK